MLARATKEVEREGGGKRRKQSCRTNGEKQLDVIAHERLYLGAIMNREKKKLILKRYLYVINLIAVQSRVIHYERHEIN